MKLISIVEFRPEHQPYFEQFNRHWIEKYFTMEPVDEYVLTNPEEAILEPGGAILMAYYDSMIAGTVGLKKADGDTFEFTKLAVSENFHRRGIAEALSFSGFSKAKELGASKVVLYTNSSLKPALALYKKLGFRQVPVINGYKRSDVKMEIGIREAIAAAVNYYSSFQSKVYEY